MLNSDSVRGVHASFRNISAPPEKYEEVCVRATPHIVMNLDLKKVPNAGSIF
jgi:hypothetical protein